ncbi:MAG: cardiolipin synthase [Pseudomonadota bacterium]|nr:cardiolipin synthase [Pseudomonadota bacterium]
MSNWPSLLTVLLALWPIVAIAAAGHALLSRRDPRTAWGWIAVCWLFPLAGPALYAVFGINRIQSRAERIGMAPRSVRQQRSDAAIGGASQAMHELDARHHTQSTPVTLPLSLHQVARTADTLTGLPLLGGQQIEALHNGAEAYPRMLAAIDAARHSIMLSSYIFNFDTTGRRFVEALARAEARGVSVRVLVDGAGEHYSWARITRVLRKKRIPCAVFNPLRLLPPSLHLNLRNHRKLLIVDALVAYTGGMNISSNHEATTEHPHSVTDVHFELRGPVIAQLAQVFEEDWTLYGEAQAQTDIALVQASEQMQGANCRVITDGPNENYDHISLVLQAAVSAAHREVLIMTPYFLPPAELAAELQTAALRGVTVRIVLPQKNNLPFVHWATRNSLEELLRLGVQVYEQPPPFCHSKLFVVDGIYSQIGSANLDARSLKLNFEIAVEIYDAPFAENLSAHVNEVIARSRQVTLDEILNRSVPARLRDALCWLFSPYL